MAEGRPNGLVFLDGGFGTMIQAAGLKPGEDPTDWNLSRPEAVTAVHRAYVEAGAEIVLANTFGANRLKYRGANDLGELVRAALANARAAGAKKVALDIGPTGRLLKPAGDLDFETAYAAFAETVAAVVRPSSSPSPSPSPSPSLVFVETMGDTMELKAAVLAAKETCDLPVWATVALGEDGKLLTGASVECVAELLESLGVDAYGFNCGLGPDRMLPYVKRLAKISTKPIIVKPNAGLPRLAEGKTVFDVGPAEFAAHVARLVEAGATIVGGCCGTTPAHISSLVSGSLASPVPRPFASPVSCLTTSGKGGRQETRDERGQKTEDERRVRVSSGTTVVSLSPQAGVVIGERINPTGKKLLREALKSGDIAYVLREAVKQTEAGAEILDVNCGVPGIDEAATMDRVLGAVQSVATVPVQIDTADPKALEIALRHVNGKPLVNSVNGSRASMDAVFPLVKKYGGALVALCLDESGIPPTAEGRLAIARRILDEGAKYGFSKRDFVFDALTLAVSADAQAAVVTLETVRRLTDELGVNTVLGVSNVSFGLPNRPALNNAMYALAKRAGLSAAIANPALVRDELSPGAEDVLLGRDPGCAKWIAANAGGTQGEKREARDTKTSALPEAIRHGLRDDARAAAAGLLADGMAPLDVIERGIVPALEEVGRGFEKGTTYLPQLLMAADAAGAAFEAVKSAMARLASPAARLSSSSGKRPIVLATVKGDVHDIGKNIVRALLENYGFRVIDLGRDVAPETIVETARRENAFLVGLSALMTTTVGAMAETIRRLKAAGVAAKTVVGGAVVTQDYADEIGADRYAKDAMRTVRYAEELSRPPSAKAARPRIALTGGIACGKSLVARYLNELGVETLDADDVVHELIPDPAERRRLAAEVFADPEKRRALEARIHPEVRRRLDAFLAQDDGRRRLVIVPLLYETGWDRAYDVVCAVSSARETQIARMVSTRGYTRAEAEARLAAQWPVSEKVARANFSIANDGTPEDLRREVARFVAAIFPAPCR